VTILPPALEYRALVIAGPTGAGKSELAVEVAERCGGEIVGADAFQVYAGLELLTAKPSPALLARVPHHLIGEIPLTERFHVAQYLALATRRLAEIRARGRLPIVVGGTGLYVRALTRGLADLPPADPALRAELEALPLAELQARLATLDPEAARWLDFQNPRRVIRALEVTLLTGKPFSSFRENWSVSAPEGLIGVVLTREREELYQRIDRRVEAMFRDGVIEEVRQTGELGPTAGQTLGLREIHAHLRGELSEEECIAAIQQATRRYAKRQLTWFRKDGELVLCELKWPSGAETVAELTLS
jgi:tRNA dimethylallyltransferase